MPQFLNFESSTLSLPDLVSYLAPLRFAFLVVIFMKLVIAGTGAYLFARVLRLHPIAAAFAGITFMFAGAFSSWLTWPLTDVVAWTGWLCGATLLAYRTNRVRYVALLAVVAAFSVYGGFPEANILVAMVLAALLVGAGITAFVRSQHLVLAGCLRSAAGLTLGGLLSAPLWFPGLQVISGSHRETEGHYAGLPLKLLPLVLTQGYFGLPTGNVATFSLGPHTLWNYYETVSYVGAVALVFVVVALVTSPRRPLVVGLALALVVSVVATYEPAAFHPFQSVMDHISSLATIRFERTRVLTGFVVAMLGAVGLDRVLNVPTRLEVRRALLIGVGLVGIGLVGITAMPLLHTLAPAAAPPHLSSVVLPAIAVLLLATVAYGLTRQATRGEPAVRFGPRVASLCCVLQAGSLLFAGVGIAAYSHDFYPPTAATERLAAIVGNQLVGLDGGNTTNLKTYTHIGFYPEINIGYGIRLFAIHDPLLPAAYFNSWPVGGVGPTAAGVGLFVPDVNSLALARRYGIGFVLVAHAQPAPAGMVAVADLSGQRLFRVPDSPRFSFTSPNTARVTGVEGDATTGFHLRTTGSSRAPHALRVTALPGWHVTIDGHAVSTTRYEGVMQSVVVPAGDHKVALWYMPGRLIVGVIAAIAAAIFLLLAGLGAMLSRRRKQIVEAAGES